MNTLTSQRDFTTTRLRFLSVSYAALVLLALLLDTIHWYLSGTSFTIASSFSCPVVAIASAGTVMATFIMLFIRERQLFWIVLLVVALAVATMIAGYLTVAALP